MNLGLLIWSYLKARPLNTALNVVLLSLGVAVIVILILFSHQIQEKISANAKGIDLVVGAKGSPMQLILCNIFHVDFPTGNIPLVDAERITRHRLVKTAIPLALGDSYNGYRIVGTSPAYTQLYEAQLREGTLWSKPMEVALGSTVAATSGLGVGDSFASSHGLTQSAHAHEEQLFRVTGILQPTGTVIDNLILTPVESIWMVHEDHTVASDSTREITAMLLQYRSPMGAIQLPRWINGQTSLQAASPAFETARLFSIMGFGLDVLNAFAAILILISALSIFIALYNSLKERRYDLAVMRTMGASRARVFFSVILEGSTLTALGCFCGILLAHFAVLLFTLLLPETGSAISAFVWYPEEGIILASGVLLGVICSFVPAWQAYRTDISRVLATG